MTTQRSAMVSWMEALVGAPAYASATRDFLDRFTVIGLEQGGERAMAVRQGHQVKAAGCDCPGRCTGGWKVVCDVRCARVSGGIPGASAVSGGWGRQPTD